MSGDDEMDEWGEILDDVEDGGGCMELAEKLSIAREDDGDGEDVG